ncbi:oxidoreductase [Mycolicibacterium hodleri]|uniref:2-dehydropantoate 2-reductase n=1 Tax=Mycolicibacterium hodleri TaxID=49897 RepID=A0A502E5G1_9MYCO|nr:oxidoreductase [Mycolicibacterium hodleri]TPG31796.1 oxidoreductase [Mycolicibacterium hodleri]
MDERSREDRVPSTSIAVVGPGAIGSTVAALMHQAGHRVLVCGHTPRDAVEVRPDPDILDGEPIVLPNPVRTDPATIEGPVAIVLLAVKDTQNADAAAWLDRLCDETTLVCVLQNGVEQTDRVGPLCPTSTVVPCAVWFSAQTQPEGWVRLRTPVRLVLPDDDAARRLAELLGGPSMTVECSPDFVEDAWRKLMTNAVAGLQVLTGRRAGMFRRDDVAVLGRAYLAECLAVARAEGARLDDGVIDDIVNMFTGVPEDLTTSILTDREQGRPLEWDVRNGVVARKGAEHGLPTPISDLVVPLLAAASDGPG